MSISLKRPRSPSLSNESKADAFDLISSDLCLYLLSFAYKDYARLVRVCRRFWTLCRSKEYWKWVGKYALKDMVPAHVLQDVDFFHGLEPNDPPWGWLGSLVLGRFKFKMDKLRLMYYKDNDNALRISVFNNYYSLATVIMDVHFQIPNHTIAKISYFHHPFLIRRAIYCNGENSVNYYVEIRDSTRQQTWYGESGHLKGRISGESALHLLYPNEKSLGVWV